LTDALRAAEGKGPSRDGPEGWREFLKPTQIERLRILPSGAPVANRGDRVATALPIVGAILASLREDHDIVLVDAPPILLVHDAALLARAMDGVLFVVSALWARPELLERARQLLDSAGAVVLGVVLNSADPARVHGYGAYYSHKD
jgi:Mrp family chromosome partitioning ATPase